MGTDAPNSRVEFYTNAKLIAAAPELLEALEGVLGMAENFLSLYMMESPGRDKDILFARQTIAKARGKG